MSTTTTRARARRWWDAGKRVLREVRQDQIPLASAGVAFFGMLALVPALIGVFTVFALVADPGHVRAQITPLLNALPGAAADAMADQLSSAANLGAQGLTFGLLASVVAVLWSTSTAVRALMTATNRAFDRGETRGFLRLRGLAVLFSLGGLVVAAVVVGAVAALPLILNVLGVSEHTRWLVGLVRWVAVVVLVGGVLAVLYRYGPDRDPGDRRWLSWGILVALVVWLGGSVGMSLYVDNFGTYHGTYGALAGIVVFLLWLYLSSFAVLLGAEVDAELDRRRREGQASSARASG
ncbi:membrane protein [Amycolatopsis arida]|uniref:Membrane protein n=1 Tax=Amycolatopsis arida TaxID=587909 RepID=A0A1I5ZRC4_9PSEU|nr:YihY/virulence factor BrkB family protein [Amycolatopsis arida]TDX89306.1 membrane protein [Amycolatopsis arida]SFQ58960.1 membrane protein [Amycolatopsis arida]